nr:MAG TPA: hypothetical protein [Caudoviricetes sp.]
MACVKCGRVKLETDFFKTPSGIRYDMCKDCLCMHIDNKDPDTFLWILKEFDVPYIEHKWIELCNLSYLKNPQKYGPKSIIGKYIRTMGMAQYKEFHYADSDRLNQEYVDKQRKVIERQEASAKAHEENEKKLLADLEAGRISQAQYETRSIKFQKDLEKIQRFEVPETAAARAAKIPKELFEESKQDDSSTVDSFPEDFQPSFAANDKTTSDTRADSLSSIGQGLGPQLLVKEDDEERIRKELFADDIKYLSVKWGTSYRPSEWVQLEDRFQKYAAEYELNSDREEVLITICKTKMKMDQALDLGDFKSYKDLSVVYDQLRRSGKFTESQNKEEATRDIDSIGQLVGFIEQEGGIIPHFESPIECPKDKIDFIIKDLKNYTSNLVKNELGLGDLIESFIEKVSENKTKSAEEMVSEGFVSVSEDMRAEMEAREYQKSHLDEVQEESMKLVEDYGA